MNEYVKTTYEGKQTPKMVECFKDYCKNNPSFLGDFDDLNFVLSTSKQDSKHSIDATVINVKTGVVKNIALRSRGEQYLRYADLTIRSLTKNGSRKTELYKIKNGISYIHFYFYCWCANESDDRILEYILVDIDRLKQQGLFEKSSWLEKQNYDGSRFISISRKVIKKHNAMIYDSMEKKSKRILSLDNLLNIK